MCTVKREHIDRTCSRFTRVRGGARRGLGGYSPPLEHTSPRRKVKSDFFRRFLAFIAPYFSPLVGRVSPPNRKIPGATPDQSGNHYHSCHWGLDIMKKMSQRTVLTIIIVPVQELQSPGTENHTGKWKAFTKGPGKLSSMI